MKDYKNLVIKSETNWIEIIVGGICFAGSVLAAGVLFCLLAV